MSMCGCNFYCELAVVLFLVPLNRGRTELHVDAKNKTIGAEIPDKEMIKFSAAYG